MLKGLIFLCGFYLLGDFVSTLFDWPIPGSILGMLLLFFFLCLRRGIPKNLRTSSHALLPYLPLFIVPASVGIINYAALLRSEGLALLIIIVVSLVIGLPLCGWIMQVMMKERSE